jgi:hypothetical protein
MGYASAGQKLDECENIAGRCARSSRPVRLRLSALYHKVTSGYSWIGPWRPRARPLRNYNLFNIYVNGLLGLFGIFQFEKEKYLTVEQAASSRLIRRSVGCCHAIRMACKPVALSQGVPLPVQRRWLSARSGFCFVAAAVLVVRHRSATGEPSKRPVVANSENHRAGPVAD